jgi:GcrA cell cycle regulator
MSLAESAAAINARFGTTYSRNAAIGRAKRMGIKGPDRPAGPTRPRKKSKPPPVRRNRQLTAEPKRLAPQSKRTDRVKLRCVQIRPRYLPLTDMQVGECRYPYGGDAEGEAITFCGHPQREGSSYCIGHFHLTRRPATASERAAVPICLRLVQAA